MRPNLISVFCLAILWTPLHAQNTPKNLPKEDVVEVPAIGEGLCVSNAFQSNMVVQRDKPLTIRGWAEPGENVTVSFAGETAKASAGADRSWQATLQPLPANSTPGAMTVAGKTKTLKLENILVGDVWLLGGQSNMEFPITNVDDGQLEIVSANFPQLRLLTIPNGKGFQSVHSFERLYEWSDWSGRHFRKGDWNVCTPETVKEFSAIGYVFGRRLVMATGVPIGLIDASLGGTTVEAWTPEDVLQKIDGKETVDMMKTWADKIAAFDPKADLQKRIDSYHAAKEKGKQKGSAPSADLRPGPVADKNRPGCRYASVIKPLTGLAIKGAVFHQGFNNCFSGSAGARMYHQVFGRMIAAWRQTFGDPDMPFCIVSLCTAGTPQTWDNFLPPMYDVGPLIREAQYKTFVDLQAAGDRNIGFASSFDQRKSFYHPQIKVPVGERVAKWALVTQYELLAGGGADEFWLPPTIKETRVEGGRIVLTMSTAVKTKDESDDRLLGFGIAGQDRKFHPAVVGYYTDGTKDNRNRPQYQKDVLVLSSPMVAQPVAYRYAWARNPMANITNGRQIPIATQRSDDWILEETPTKVVPPAGRTEDDAGRYAAGVLRKEMELIDTVRRIKEAQATIAELTPIIEKAAADAEKRKADAEKKAAEAKKAEAARQQ